MNHTKLPSFSRNTRRYVWFCVLFIAAFVFAFTKLGSEMLEQELRLFDSTVIGWVQSGISPAGGVLFNLVLKWSYHRERPGILRLVEEKVPGGKGGDCGDRSRSHSSHRDQSHLFGRALSE
jgi:hypothetical protein